MKTMMITSDACIEAKTPPFEKGGSGGISPRQRGLATVEAMLALPLLLAVLLLAEQALHLLLLKQHNVTVARTAASLPQTERGGKLWGVTCQPSAEDPQSWNAARTLLNPLAQGEHRQALVNTIRQAGEPTRITATAWAQYHPLGHAGFALPVFQDRHTIESLTPTWQLTELNIGHDRYLKEQLTTRRLFRELFPKAP